MKQNIWIWVIVIAVAVFLFMNMNKSQPAEKQQAATPSTEGKSTNEICKDRGYMNVVMSSQEGCIAPNLLWQTDLSICCAKNGLNI